MKSAVKKFKDHCDKDHWELMPAQQVPLGRQVIDAVWTMKRKQDIKT